MLALAAAVCFVAVSTAASAAQAPAPLPPSAAVSVGVDGTVTFDAAWKAIRDTYVDDTRTEADWQRLRDEYRPRAAAAESDEALRTVLREMLGRLGRSHFELLSSDVHSRLAAAATSPADAGDVGLEVTPLAGRAVVHQVVPGGPAAVAGVQPGWIVERIGEDAVTDTDGFRLWTIATALLRGRTGSPVTVAFRDHADRLVDVTLTRTKQQGQPVTLGHLPTFFARLEHRRLGTGGGPRVHYIHFNVWMTPLAADIDRAVHAAREADGIILDLRHNPGGVLTMLMGVSGHFLPAPTSLGTLRTRDSELRLVANPRVLAADGSRVTPYAGPLAILVDETSYSASEIFAAGMQALGRARVFGRRTPGGALPAMLRKLPNGDVLEYAIGDFVTASGDRIEGRGVVPDHPVEPTREALAAGEDPVMAAAFAWIAEASRP
jgi:carboxyl-terminal processing protease